MRKIESISLSRMQAPERRACDMPGCAAAGDYRAPRSREQLDEFHWFCLDHVREYNRAWNYCSGMSEKQIEREIRLDADGHAEELRHATPQQKALRCMALVPPVSLTQLKARYKELVKQFHPDANGGDKSAEERLKDINDAYTTLKRFLTASAGA
jgi:hypothetical protein